jgi:hypothetical protein
MSVSAFSSGVSAQAAVAKPSVAATTTVASDGDSKVKAAGYSKVKDADGDYKRVSAASAAGKSSGAVQSALSLLTKGG